MVLGACPVIAVTTSVTNGLGMGMAATLVLLGSNFVISSLRNFIPDKVRIPAYMVVISAFVTIIQLLMQAFVPALYESLGIFLPLIVVNCIILARAEAFAGKNNVVPSIVDGIGMGLGFTLALVMIAAVRELLGTGGIMGLQVLGANFEPVLLFILAPGGFLAFGLLLGILNAIGDKRKSSKANKEVKAA